MRISRWDQEFDYETTIEVLLDLSTRHSNRVSDPALRGFLTEALHNRRFADLVGCDIDYDAGYSVSDVMEMRQALGFFSKLEPLKLGVDKEHTARRKFSEAEALCRETNEIFRLWSAGEFNFPRGVDSILFAAQRKIAKVLGPLPALSELDFTFGPGATTSVPRRRSCSRIKLSSKFSCSANAVGLLPTFLQEIPLWLNNQVETYWLDGDDLVEQVTVEISHGKLAFVPKNAKTYRTVMTEPTLNTLIQGGYGKYIAARLARIGQNIHDQERNKNLARVGSLTRSLATLDLSSASDTISKELVAHLLPYEWYSALDSCRTPTALDGDSIIHLAKFSSMGNGFTFPLQTLIFWALVSSCCSSIDDTVSVYGDDIICPVEAVPRILEVFRAVGFIVNTDKSFWRGPFRESCGADFYFGVNVRPAYTKDLLSCEKLYVLHNHYVRQFDDEMASEVLKYIPEDLRLWGPDGFGDGVLLGPWKPKPHGREHGWSGYLFDSFISKGKAHVRVLPGDRVLPAYTIYVKGENVNSLPYGRSTGTVALRIGKDGVLRDPLPGSSGYKRVTIYTLTCA